MHNHKTVPIKPLKFEIVHLILLHLTRYSQNEIFKIDMSLSLSNSAEKNKQINTTETKKLLLGLEQNFKSFFFDGLPAISAPYLNESQRIRGLCLPKYTLKDFSHLNAREWKNTVQKFLEDNKAAVERLPKWLHAWFFKSEMEKLSNKATQKERGVQAVNSFYYLLYKSDYLYIKEIESKVYNYASNEKSEMFALFTDITHYIHENSLTENIFYTRYLRKILNSTSQNELLYANSEMEKNTTKELILQKNQEIEELSIKLQESQNSEIMKEMGQLKPALEMATKEMQKAKQEIEKLKNDMELLQKDITFVTEEKNELQQKCSNLINENMELKKQKEELEIKLQEAELRLSKAEKEIYSLRLLLNEPNKNITGSMSVTDCPLEKSRERTIHSLNNYSVSLDDNYGHKIFDPKVKPLQQKNDVPVNNSKLTAEEKKECVIF